MRMNSGQAGATVLKRTHTHTQTQTHTNMDLLQQTTNRPTISTWPPEQAVKAIRSNKHIAADEISEPRDARMVDQSISQRLPSRLGSGGVWHCAVESSTTGQNSMPGPCAPNRGRLLCTMLTTQSVCPIVSLMAKFHGESRHNSQTATIRNTSPSNLNGFLGWIEALASPSRC